MTINVRVLWRGYGRCPSHLARGNVPLVYFDTGGALLCAGCANERAYDPRLTRLTHAEPLAVQASGFFCDSCLRGITHAGV